MDEKDLYAYVGEAVEAELGRVGSSRALPIDNSVREYVLAGKRVRPLTFLLALKAERPDLLNSREVRQVCAAIEVCHRSTLVSDDVIDGQATRNGHRTIAVAESRSVAVLVAPYLQALALDICPAKYRAHINAGVRDTLAGQIMQERQKLASMSLVFRENEKVVRYKSSSIGAAGLRVAREMLADPQWTESVVDDLSWAMARAYQTCNDIADVSLWVEGRESRLPSDVANRTPTLPILIALRDSAGRMRRELLSYFNGRSSELPDCARRVFVDVGAVEKCREVVKENLACAVSIAVRILPNTPARDQFVQMVQSQWRDAYLLTGG